MDLVHHLHGYLETYGYLAIFVIVGLEKGAHSRSRAIPIAPSSVWMKPPSS